MMLLLGTIFVLFWSQIAAEMNIIIHTMQDEVKLWEVNYDAEGMLTVLLREYEANSEAMAEGVMTVYESDGRREVAYRLHKPKRSGDEGRLTVSVLHKQTGLRGQYTATFTDEVSTMQSNSTLHNSEDKGVKSRILIKSVRRLN